MRVYRGGVVQWNGERPAVTSLPRGPRPFDLILCGRCGRWLAIGWSPAECVAARVPVMRCGACRSWNDVGAAVQEPEAPAAAPGDAQWHRYAAPSRPAASAVLSAAVPSAVPSVPTE